MFSVKIDLLRAGGKNFHLVVQFLNLFLDIDSYFELISQRFFQGCYPLEMNKNLVELFRFENKRLFFVCLASTCRHMKHYH